MGAGLQRAFAAARATQDNPLAGCGKIQRAAFEALAIGLEPRIADATRRALMRKGLIAEGPHRSLGRDALGEIMVPTYFVPIAVHARWCEWCDKAAPT